MNKSESKYYNTSIKLDQAFLRLLEKKEFEYITVKEICAEAKVNRSTFYLHYETIGDLLEETMDYVNAKFKTYFSQIELDVKRIDALPLSELYLITPEYINPCLTFIKENKKLFQTFLKRHDTLNLNKFYSSLLKYVIKPILKRFNVDEKDYEYVFLFYVEGIIGIIKKWVKEGVKRPIEEISALIIKLVKTN